MGKLSLNIYILQGSLEAPPVQSANFKDGGSEAQKKARGYLMYIVKRDLTLVSESSG